RPSRRSGLLDHSYAFRISAGTRAFTGFHAPDRSGPRSGFTHSPAPRRSAILSGAGAVSVRRDDLRFHVLAASLIGATILLMWFGYRAASEWQHSTRLLVEQRTLEVETLAIMAINRDMRGVQAQVLPQLDPIASQSEPYQLGDEVAKVFARFPY